MIVAAVESLELSALSERIVRENGDGIGFKLFGKSVRSPAFSPQAPDADLFRYTKRFRLKAGLQTKRFIVSECRCGHVYDSSDLHSFRGRSRRSGDRLPARLQIWPARGRTTPRLSRRRPARRATRRGC